MYYRYSKEWHKRRADSLRRLADRAASKGATYAHYVRQAQIEAEWHERQAA